MANPTYELRVIDSMSAPSTRKTQNADFRKRVPAGVAPNGKLRILPNPQRFISRRADFLRVRPATRKKGAHRSSLSLKSGAGDESRTRDLNLGKVALYQLSYSRVDRIQDPGPGGRRDWSGRRVSNSRPQPWQGCALPTELLPQSVLRRM